MKIDAPSMPMDVLLIDIGNTRIKWRIVDRRCDWPTRDDAPAGGVCSTLASDGLAALSTTWRSDPQSAIAAVHMSNVAGPQVEEAVRDAIRTAWGDLTIHALVPGAAQCGVVNGYRDPSLLGPDRWAAMLGAHALVPDRELLVCSFGTATTIDLLLTDSGASDHGASRVLFAGGLILPGIEAMRRALAHDAARLSLADGKVVDFADRTDDAIAGGIVAAQAGAVMRAVRDARARIASRDPDVDRSRALSCVLAGGGANAMAAHLCDLDLPMRIEPGLVLRGLHAIAREEVATARDRQPLNDPGRTRHSPLARQVC